MTHGSTSNDIVVRDTNKKDLYSAYLHCSIIPNS